MALPRQTRREVMRLAREGHRHPDVEVASVANDWAQSLVERPSHRLLLGAVYEIAAVICVLGLVHWIFGTSVQGISYLFTAPLIVLAINFQIRSMARQITQVT
jgi:hypothetical protein